MKRKVLSLILAAGMVVSLAGCGSSETQTQAPAAPETQQAPAQAAPETQKIGRASCRERVY